MGPTGRGVCDYYGVDFSEVDILMGTYTKSFAAVGGYVAADKHIIDHIRRVSFGTNYSVSMTPGCCQQILTAMSIISGEDGTNEGQQKLQQLRDNSNYFRNRLISEGFKILGDHDSPVVPLMLYHPGKISAFSRECLARKVNYF